MAEQEIAARAVVAVWHETRLSDRKGPRLQLAIERLARTLTPHPDIADALEWLDERDGLLAPLKNGEARDARRSKLDAEDRL